jgi:uncharacterized phiE125 gp8 family phage protein
MIVYSRVIDSPESEPVTLEEVKTHLRIDGSDEDSYLTSLIVVARTICEAYAGLSFLTQTRVVKLDKLCGDVILPYGPVQSVSDFIYLDGDGTEQAIASDTYTLDTQSGLTKIRVTENWPDTNRTLNNVAITYVAGYETVPEVIKHAIKMQVATLYENRQDEVVGQVGHMIGWSSQALLDTVKVYWNAEA